MSDTSFQRVYTKLNPKQREAVDAIEGPVMVIAGPGTGKTSVLTLRIANILHKTDTPADGILALTFTESAVHSMRKKLTDYIGAQAYRVNLFTFHGFAQEIINRYPEYFPRIIGGAVASESERLIILEEVLTKGRYDLIRPFGRPLLYVRKALSVIADLKRDTYTTEAFQKLLENERRQLEKVPAVHAKGRFKGETTKEHTETVRNNARNLELAKLYGAYETELRKRGLYDFEDMLIELVAALKKHKDLLRSLQEAYLYLLADEHQDANNAQNAVLELLSDYADTRNLFIVGDEKQAIYRFQGASLENFLYFKKKFPDARLVYLDENYRSTQTILDASHALMATDGRAGDLPLRPRLTAAVQKSHPMPVRLIAYENAESELSGIANDIKKAVKGGIAPHDIAVLARTNAEIAPVGNALEAASVPYTLFSDDDALDDPVVGKLLVILRAVVSPESDALVGEMMFVDFLGLEPMDAVRLNRTASERRVSPLELLYGKRMPAELLNAKAAKKLSQDFRRWMQYARNKDASDAFLSIVQESGLQEHIIGLTDALSVLEKLSRLYDEVKLFLVAHKRARLADFVSSLETLARHGSKLSLSRPSFREGGVSVMTAHKAKGLEWRAVYLVHAADRIWGNRRSVGGFRLPPPLSSAGESEREEDERRLFYVALTRAKECIALSYARTDVNGRDRLPTRFSEEIPPLFLKKVEGEHQATSERMAQALRALKSGASGWDKRELTELFLEHGMNATALNNYLECPWKYFFRNLVRLPDVPGKYLHFGTAVHAALKALADAKRERKAFAPADFTGTFEKALARLPLSHDDFRAALSKGKDVLPKYFAAREPSWHNESLSEYSITGVFLSLPDKTNLLLRGRLDKLELLSGSSVNVVDYKTGSHKTRNEILGKTKNSNGDIKRQLNFYRLLLELHDKGKHEMVSADVDFVEPDKAGKIRNPERFDMSHEDALAVSEEIRRVADEIRSFSFWDERCGEKDCEYCQLRELLV